MSPFQLRIVLTIGCLLGGVVVHNESAFGKEPLQAKLVQSPTAISVSLGSQEVMRYHIGTVPSPEGMDPDYARSGYIHPLKTLQGRTVTGDFSPDHPHQHALFAAWVKTKFNGHPVDFWNQQRKTGNVVHHAVDSVTSDAKGVRFTVQHRYIDVTDPEQSVDVLAEEWDVSVPHQQGPDVLFDIHVRQKLIADSPLELAPYLYGGMAMRGGNQWVREGAAKVDRQYNEAIKDGVAAIPPSLDQIGFAFLTSEGLGRHNGNHSKARWVDIHGKTDDELVGVTVLSHPDNFRAPQSVRLHPSMPYFCFAPVVEEGFVIDKNHPYNAKYRYIVHDGLPDAVANDRRWEEYAAE
ncbi:hypothetical protein FF011L_07280 [Roseimaritima multifibrata]|uniref:Methane oxygenase PmoA n=1 Tax=Roseimaritima multifibrata TaxID=1930274 RepID=A0A517MAT0_9BACT|nr:PmoA family protein [Roseimaritima multifibrata]QDS91992.1 hypothetical protein FF011L_07280 [Roseimaritima multifibrata]